ncbi:MAG: hypothetical protein CL938_04975 [Deltaproteobacteria bacterium]|jgi:hypothetical protein|nr:hypothetical protein [Deltaproteobacteria bacterium]MCP4193315.1 hypothetical protein [Planctomycetaceae bacterium]
MRPFRLHFLNLVLVFLIELERIAHDLMYFTPHYYPNNTIFVLNYRNTKAAMFLIDALVISHLRVFLDTSRADHHV